MAKPIVHGVKERPILFSGPMIRALLDGSKTQTRRVMKAPWDVCNGDPIYRCGPDGHGFRADKLPPYGQPGERLWVRETWSANCPEVRYQADLSQAHFGDGPYRAELMRMYDRQRGEWRPSIHMPRWASRILLEIISVRVERLNEISESDARAEGCPCYVCGAALDGRSEADCHCFHRKAAPSDYRHLWEQINGAGSWDANPFVWAIEFKRVAA